MNFSLLISRQFSWLIFVLGLTIMSQSVFAQKPLNPIQDNGPKSKIQLIRADSLVGENSISRLQTFRGNVIFNHQGTLLGCNTSIHNQSSNLIEAYGKVVINQGDTLTIVGDTLLYDGNTRFARVFGKSVVLRDKKVTLTTTKIYYDLKSSQAYYPVPGYLKQDSSTLTSKIGYYNTKTKIFNYIGDVQIINPSYVLCTDSLDYNAITKQTVFKTFTTIKSKNGDLSAYKGTYNIKTKVSNFKGRAKVSNIDFSLEGDTLDYDNIADKGKATGNVVFVSYKDSLKTVGDKAIRDKSTGLTRVMGDTYTEKVNVKDTLLLKCDTLYIFEKTNKKDTASKVIDKNDITKIIADGKVKVYKIDFQSISDSLVYNMLDSTIQYFNDPLIWNNQNQMEADTINIFLKNNRLKTMLMIDDCFAVEIDTVKNYNQIKGRKLLADFGTQSVLKSINVEGNGESNYFALDDKNRIIGLNKVQSASMKFYFGEKKISHIVFKGKPESLLIPPREIIKADLYLENFEWKDKLRPIKPHFYSSTRGQILAKTTFIH